MPQASQSRRTTVISAIGADNHDEQINIDGAPEASEPLLFEAASILEDDPQPVHTLTPINGNCPLPQNHDTERDTLQDGQMDEFGDAGDAQRALPLPSALETYFKIEDRYRLYEQHVAQETERERREIGRNDMH